MPEASSLEAALKRLLDGVASESDLQNLRQARITLAMREDSIALGGDITNSLVNIRGQVVEFRGVSPEAMREVLAAMYPPRLFQLPADLPDFTGREKEVAVLLTVLRGGAGQAAISALGGMGGSGKTALAVHAAHKLAPEFPEAQIVVDLLGTADTPLSPVAAMGYVVRAFHPEARLPESFGEMAGLYRSVLAGKRALLLLDNAQDGAQVRELLPPAPCGVLVTSRRTIVLPGVAPLNLDVLPEPQAVALLAAILGPGRAAAGELADLAQKCGYLPLALKIAGSFLAGHADWSVAEYVRALAQAKERLQRLKHEDLEVEAVLGLSAAQLAREQPDLAARWQMLCIFPASFGRLAAAAVWEVDENETRDSLSELLNRSLVLFDKEKSRYRLHDLMRPVARNAFGYGGAAPDREAEAKRLHEAARRHASHYAEVLQAANLLYQKGGEAVRAGLDLFDTEWDNLRAGQAWAATHSGEGEAADRLCSHYPDAGVDVLSLRLHPREWIEWLTAALAAARRLQDRAAEGWHLGNLGIAYFSLGEYRRAIEYHEQSLAIAREMGNRRDEGSALGNLGIAYSALGEYRRAIECYGKQLEINLEIGYRRGEGHALGNLGIAYFSLGEYRRAMEYHEQSLAIAREMGNRQYEGSALGSLGSAYLSLGEYRRAIKFYEKQLEITLEIGDRRGEGNALGNLGISYFYLGEYRRAIEYYERAMVISQEIGDRQGEGSALTNLGIAYKDLGEPRRAIDYHEQALVISREIGDRQGEGNALGNLGNAYYALGEPRRAIEYHEQDLAITLDIGDRRGGGATLGNLGLAYAALGEPRRAMEFYEQQLDIAREMGDRVGEGNALWNMSLVLDKLGERPRALACAEASLKIREDIESPHADKVRRQLAAWRREG